ncbi:MAG: SMC-Scp complex subunit ScpB [Candidatus Jorgensenbacteria bacterium]|nr:SMC-Scp complex subunit ScpB [Candidatus Jorgensenbacteria bacterium]
MRNLEAACEAALFYHGASITVAKLAKLLAVTPEECRVALAAFGETLAATPARGLTLVMNGDEVALATKPELKGLLETLMKGEFEESLTPAALETLSLVSYLGPVPRSSVDFVRGVNSSFTLRNLLLRGLIERVPAPKGGGYVYSASMEFLKHMGLRKVAELPEYEKYRTFYHDFELAVQDQPAGQGVAQETTSQP